jgi:hypothetical protein
MRDPSFFVDASTFSTLVRFFSVVACSMKKKHRKHKKDQRENKEEQ